MHWHGLHIPWSADGSPFHPIAPGEQADFVFTIHRGTAGFCQVFDRNGVPEPYPSWKDTVNMPKHEAVRFIVRFDDYPGSGCSTAISSTTRNTA